MFTDHIYRGPYVHAWIWGGVLEIFQWLTKLRPQLRKMGVCTAISGVDSWLSDCRPESSPSIGTQNTTQRSTFLARSPVSAHLPLADYRLLQVHLHS